MRGLWNYQNIINSKSNLRWHSVVCWWKPKFWQYCCWTVCGWLFPSLWEMGATSCSAVHLHSVVYPLELQWCLLLSVTSPQRSDCFSGFGSSEAALRLTEEGMVHGVEQVHCKKLHSGSGLFSTKGLWFLVSNQKASKEHWHLKDWLHIKKIDFILKIHYFPASWRRRKWHEHYNSCCEHSLTASEGLASLTGCVRLGKKFMYSKEFQQYVISLQKAKEIVWEFLC